MSLAADALQSLLVAELIALSGRTGDMSLPDVIIAPGVGYDLDFDATDQSIKLDFRESQLIVAALASDSCRFACASFQTLSLIEEEIADRDRSAWGLVKLYYAAFYAGHALIRLFGQGCSYFERPHITRLNDLGAALGRTPPFKIEGGLYKCTINSKSSGIRCTKARGMVGGAHEAFWQIFGDLIQQSSESILHGPMDPMNAQMVFSKIEEFRSTIRRRGNYGWLSSVRNDLQYRHRFEIWFPSQVTKRERERLARLAIQWRRDPMDIDTQTGRQSDLAEFCGSCAFVIALCRSMLDRLAERSTATKSFVHFGPLAFLHDVQPRDKLHGAK